VAQIAYTEKTADGRLRHPRFLGMRADKPAREVRTMKDENNDGDAVIQGVRLTHPDRVMFPEQGSTKRAIAEYYAAYAEKVLKHLAGRPLSLVRCPDGRSGKCFYQKHSNDSVPSEIDTVKITEKDGDARPYLVVNSAKGLVATAQIGALELHVWGCRVDAVEKPERIVFDLDPDESVTFDAVRSAARELRDVLQAANLASFPLLTGGKGIHVVVPIRRTRNWDEVKSFARGFAGKLVTAAPGRYVATASKSKRKGKIFIDWLRNERGATAIAPYSIRARRGAPVATPVSWRELTRMESAAQFSLDNIGQRLVRLNADPWLEFTTAKQSITNAHLEAVG
jgi:bifunctional non-homologous end joining protein LigD